MCLTRRVASFGALIILWAPLAALADQVATLSASDGAADDRLGVAVAADAVIVVAGASFDDGTAGADQGSVYVFARPAGGWSGSLQQVARLLPSDPVAGAQFGAAVAVDGDTIVVGAPGPAVGGTARAGTVYVYVRPAGGWSGTLMETARLVASDGNPGDELGVAVAIAGDLVAAGASFDDDVVGLNRGAAYVYRRPAGGWVGTRAESAKLIPSDGAAGDLFGSEVAVAAGAVVVAAPYADIGDDANRGAAYVFNMPGGGWAGEVSENARLTSAAGSANDNFGFSLAAAATTVVAGTRKAVAPNLAGGTGYVFVRPDGGWSGNLTEAARLMASDIADGMQFGWSVAIGIGEEVLVGAPQADIGAGTDQGAAYRFRRPPSGWSGTINEAEKLTAVDAGDSDALGMAVAFSGDHAVVGAPLAAVSGTSDRGRVVIFDPAPGRTLTVEIGGAGTVISNPAGIDCPGDCTGIYAANSVVELTATPEPNAIFVSWGGDSTDCQDGVVTMTADLRCRATFSEVMLGVNITVEGEGRVTSDPPGISCTAGCTEFFPRGTVITLRATPDPGWEFAGWSGATDCDDGQITVLDAMGCTATFTEILMWGVDISIEGEGRVTSEPDGIDCSADCVEFFPDGTVLTLTAVAAPGFEFAGWSGSADCSDGRITVTANLGCRATFEPLPELPDLTGEWDRLRRFCIWDRPLICLLFGQFDFRNSSSVEAGASRLRYVLSADNVLDDNDLVIGTRRLGQMPPGGPREIVVLLLLPLGSDGTGMYVLAVVDALDAVEERNESNNVIVFGPLR